MLQFSHQAMSDSFVFPWSIVCQAPLSMGFSRQEYWSGLPFPTPGDLPNLWTEPTSPTLAGVFFTTEPLGKVKVVRLCPVLHDPHGLYSPWNSLGQNTRVGSLSLLQGIFPTQGSKPGIPHCRRILYQLSHQGSPSIIIKFHKNILLGESAALRQSSPLFQGMLDVSASQIF